MQIATITIYLGYFQTLGFSSQRAWLTGLPWGSMSANQVFSDGLRKKWWGLLGESFKGVDFRMNLKHWMTQAIEIGFLPSAYSVYVLDERDSKWPLLLENVGRRKLCRKTSPSG